MLKLLFTFLTHTDELVSSEQRHVGEVAVNVGELPVDVSVRPQPLSQRELQGILRGLNILRLIKKETHMTM